MWMAKLRRLERAASQGVAHANLMNSDQALKMYK
jgi:hypothetical protein